MLGGRSILQTLKYRIEHSSHWHMNWLSDTVYIDLVTSCIAHWCTWPLCATILTCSVPAGSDQGVHHILIGVTSSAMMHLTWDKTPTNLNRLHVTMGGGDFSWWVLAQCQAAQVSDDDDDEHKYTMVTQLCCVNVPRLLAYFYGYKMTVRLLTLNTWSDTAPHGLWYCPPSTWGQCPCWPFCLSLNIKHVTF